MKAWIGVDPGVSGAMAIIFEDSTCTYMDWVDENSMCSVIMLWASVYELVAVALEDTPAMRRDSKQSATTFQQHCGAWKCLIRIAGFEPVMVRPLTWMKRRVEAKRNHSDKPSLRYVASKYPYIYLTGPRGGKKDGRSDAICIAEWIKEQYNEGG